MNKHYPRFFSISSAIWLALFLSIPVHAQIDQFDRGGFGLIESRIDSYFVPSTPVAQNVNSFAVSAGSATVENISHFLMVPIVKNEAFWINHDFSSIYNFSFKHSKSDGSDTDQNSGAVGFFLDSQIGFCLKPSFKHSYPDNL